MMYDEQRYTGPTPISSIVMHITGNDGVKYYLCYCNGDDICLVNAGASQFMATLDYVVTNGFLHAMTEDGTFLDHQIDYRAWCKFREYCGIYEEPPKDKYTAWLES